MTTKSKTKQSKRDKKKSESKFTEDCDSAVFDDQRFSGNLFRTAASDERRTGCDGGVDISQSSLQPSGTFVGLREFVADLARLFQSAANDLNASKTPSLDAHVLPNSRRTTDTDVIQSALDSRRKCEDEGRHAAVCCNPVDLIHRRCVDDQRSAPYDVESRDSFQFHQWSRDKTPETYHRHVSNSDIPHVASTSRDQQSIGFAAGAVSLLSAASRLVVDGVRPRTPLLPTPTFLPATMSSAVAVAPERMDSGHSWYGGPSDGGACCSSVYGRIPHRPDPPWCSTAAVNQSAAAAGPLLPLYYDRNLHDIRSMSTLSCCSTSTDGTATCSTPGSQQPLHHGQHRPLQLMSVHETPIEIPLNVTGCRDYEAFGGPSSSAPAALPTAREPTDPRRGKDYRPHRRQLVGADLPCHVMQDPHINCSYNGSAMDLSCVKRQPVTSGTSVPPGCPEV